MNALPDDNQQPEISGLPQNDPEDPTISGDTLIEQKHNHFDVQFYHEMLHSYEDPKYREILINTDKLTKNAFNITVPYREVDLIDLFKEIGMEDTSENRQAFYELIYSTPKLSDYMTGAILTDELIRHPEKKFQKILEDNKLIIGRRIESQTNLKQLQKYIKEYYQLGCRFAIIRQDFSIISQIESAR